MTRLFGCISNQPQRLGEALESVRAALVAPGPLARWGLGYVHSGEVLLSLHPRQVEGELDFYPVVSGLASDYLVGAADVDDGLRGQVNTQPFRYRRWLFAAENQAISEPSSDGAEAVCNELQAHIPDFLRRNLRGRSTAEHVFHLLLAMLHDAGELDDVNLPSTALRRALRDTIAFATAAATRVGSELALGNLVTTNSRSMMAVRLTGPLWVRRLRKQVDPKRPESQFRSVLVVSSATSPGEGFEEVGVRSALAIARDVSTDLHSLDD
jgi:hypothetical protein